MNARPSLALWWGQGKIPRGFRARDTRGDDHGLPLLSTKHARRIQPFEYLRCERGNCERKQTSKLSSIQRRNVSRGESASSPTASAVTNVHAVDLSPPLQPAWPSSGIYLQRSDVDTPLSNTAFPPSGSHSSSASGTPAHRNPFFCLICHHIYPFFPEHAQVVAYLKEISTSKCCLLATTFLFRMSSPWLLR